MILFADAKIGGVHEAQHIAMRSTDRMIFDHSAVVVVVSGSAAIVIADGRVSADRCFTDAQ